MKIIIYIKKIAHKISREIPFVGKIVLRLGLLYRQLIMHKQRKRYGSKNKDIIFYVIRQSYLDDNGVLANYLLTLDEIGYANEKGYYPIIDFKNYPTSYSAITEVNGTKNAWEYFFEQPINIALDEVYRSANVILSGAPLYSNSFSKLERIEIEKRAKLATSVPLNSEMREFIEKHGESFIKKVEKSKCLGVYYRGTTYKLVEGAPSISSFDEYADIVADRMGKFDCDCIFLVADEQEFVDYMCERFDSKVLYVRHPRVEGFDNRRHEGRFIEEETPKGVDIVENLKWYLQDVYIFSRCYSLIGPLTSGFYSAILWGNIGLENIEIL